MGRESYPSSGGNGRRSAASAPAFYQDLALDDLVAAARGKYNIEDASIFNTRLRRSIGRSNLLIIASSANDYCDDYLRDDGRPSFLASDE